MQNAKLTYYYPLRKHYGYSSAAVYCDLCDNNKNIADNAGIGWDERDACLECFIKACQSGTDRYLISDVAHTSCIGRFLDNIPDSVLTLNYGHLSYRSGTCLRCRAQVQAQDNVPVIESQRGLLCLKCTDILAKCLRPLYDYIPQ